MNVSLNPDRQTRWFLVAVLSLALAARLYWIVVADPMPKLVGGDGPVYLSVGQAIARKETLLMILAQGLIAVGPAYPAYLAVWYWLLPVEAVVLAARLGQAVMDTAMCGLVFDLGRRVFDQRVGLVAALAIAVDLRFITQAGAINTETLFILFLVAGVWSFIIVRSTPAIWRFIGANALLLLAAFTRAIALPLSLIFDVMLMSPKPTMAQFKRLALISLVVIAVVGGWALRVYLTTGQFVLVSVGLDSNFWMGSRSDGQWHGIAAFEAERKELQARYGGGDAYVEDALRTIAADPVAYVRLLFTKVIGAYAQPHGTVAFSGESLKELTVAVLRGKLSLSELINGTAFWPKLYIYIFHFTSLVGGILGLWLARRNWLKVLPLVIPIVYLTIVYTLLTIIPRYIFPAMPFYMLLTAHMIVTLFARSQAAKERIHNARFTMPDASIGH